MKLSSSLLPLLLPLLVLAVVKAEHHYFGHCPRFSPVRGFDWEKVSRAQCESVSSLSSLLSSPREFGSSPESSPTILPV